MSDFASYRETVKGTLAHLDVWYQASSGEWRWHTFAEDWERKGYDYSRSGAIYRGRQAAFVASLCPFGGQHGNA